MNLEIGKFYCFTDNGNKENLHLKGIKFKYLGLVDGLYQLTNMIDGLNYSIESDGFRYFILWKENVSDFAKFKASRSARKSKVTRKWS